MIIIIIIAITTLITITTIFIMRALSFRACSRQGFTWFLVELKWNLKRPVLVRLIG